LYILCFCIVLCIFSAFFVSPIFVPVYRPLLAGSNPVEVNKYHIKLVL
jgi:hypothetical protein